MVRWVALVCLGMPVWILSSRRSRESAERIFRIAGFTRPWAKTGFGGGGEGGGGGGSPVRRSGLVVGKHSSGVKQPLSELGN